MHSPAAAPALRALALLALLLAACRPADNDRWVRLQAGNRWTYEVSRELRLRLGRQEQLSTRVSTRTVEVLSVGQRIEVREAEELRESEGSLLPPPPRRVTVDLASERDGLYLHRQRVEDPDQPQLEEITYNPPVRLLRFPLTAPSHWTVGVIRAGKVFSSMDAAASGPEEVSTKAGTFRGCMRVTGSGNLHGTFPLPDGGEAEIVSGRQEASTWYAPGVGEVRLETSSEMKVRLSSGLVLDALERTIVSLQETSVTPRDGERR